MLALWIICFIINLGIVMVWWLKNGTSIKIDSVFLVKFLLLFLMGPIALLFVGMIFLFTNLDKIFEKLDISVSPEKIRNLFK